MTSLTITPNVERKRLKLAGTVASGEKVAVTVAGSGETSATNLRLRVMAGPVTVGVFPPEETDGWTVAGDDLMCVLSLATEQAERHCKFGAETCVLLEDTGIPQLYGAGPLALCPWVKMAEVDVPVNLDDYKSKVAKSASDSLLDESLDDAATQKETRQMVQKILAALKGAATCAALMCGMTAFGVD